MLLPGRLFADVVRSLPPGEVTLELRSEQRDVEIAAGGARFHLRTLPAEDFPRLPELEGETVKLPGAPLAETIELVARAASRDEVRPILTGVLLQAEGNTLTMVATDSYRLSVKHTELEAPVAQPLEANVPARALRELARIIAAEGAEEVEIALPRNQAVFQRRRRGPLVAADRGPVPELAPADPGVVRARRAPAARGVPRDHPPDQPARPAQRAAAARVRRGRADGRRRDAGHRRRQRGDAGAVLRRAAGDRLQPAVPGRGDRERRHRAGRDPAQLAAAPGPAAPGRRRRLLLSRDADPPQRAEGVAAWSSSP